MFPSLSPPNSTLSHVSVLQGLDSLGSTTTQLSAYSKHIESHSSLTSDSRNSKKPEGNATVVHSLQSFLLPAAWFHMHTPCSTYMVGPAHPWQVTGSSLEASQADSEHWVLALYRALTPGIRDGGEKQCQLHTRLFLPWRGLQTMFRSKAWERVTPSNWAGSRLLPLWENMDSAANIPGHNELETGPILLPCHPSLRSKGAESS